MEDINIKQQMDHLLHLPTQRSISTPNKILSISCMLLMVQVYLVAPLQPSLCVQFNSALMNITIPAFAIPFAISAAGVAFRQHAVKLSNWVLFSLLSLCSGTLLLSITTTAEAFLLIRIFTGFATGVMLPSTLLLATRSEKKGSLANMVLIIFSVATGMTFGPSIGGWLNGIIGWRSLYRIIGILFALLSLLYFINNKPLHEADTLQLRIKAPVAAKAIWKKGYIYAFVYLTGVFHSGVFVWISYYFTTQYGLDERQIANDLFIFGFPGLTVAMLLYRYHLDTKVIRILYAGLILTITGIFLLMAHMPLWLAECLLGVMSVGFSCTQPLFIGIFRIPPAAKSITAPMAKGSGLLFAGYGSGPLMMIALLDAKMVIAMIFLVLLFIALVFISRHVWIDSALQSKAPANYGIRNKGRLINRRPV